LPGWAEDNRGGRLACLHALLPRYGSKAARAIWKRVCDLAKLADGKPKHDPRRFFEENLKPYAVVAGDGTVNGLITGYYEPLLRGSRTRLRVLSSRCVACRMTC
jgi:membrane-bound lytic murein transglycosylase A